ncbi:MAG: sugar transferase [Bacteroidales bacterium]|nr:sugar transferase [Bacteroidales bacterium]
MYKHFFKRFFDILFSLIGLLLLSPILLIIAILIKTTSKGRIFYRQIRVGKDNKDFFLLKFRTMRENADKNGLLTVGNHDNRITKIGYYLRKTKADELPQLLNVLKGEMSIVGPRPEVRKYVDYYTEEQRKVLLVRPGLTDIASIAYINENEILAQAENPEQTYIEQIMQEKLKLNFEYIAHISLRYDVHIVCKTLFKIIWK